MRIHLLSNLIILISLISFSNSLKSDVDLKLDGDGFHRNVIAIMNLISPERLVHCKVLYKFYIPFGVYLDLETLRIPSAASGGHISLNWYSPDNFDIEKNIDEEHGIGNTKEKVLHICSERSILNSFLFNETFTFPIHLYYGRAVDNSDPFPFKEIEFQRPDILVSCEKRKMEGRYKILKAPCICPTGIRYDREKEKKVKFCNWLVTNSSLSLVERAVVKTRVPIGQIGFSAVAVWGTIVAVGVCCVYLFYVTCSDSRFVRKLKRN